MCIYNTTHTTFSGCDCRKLTASITYCARIIPRLHQGRLPTTDESKSFPVFEEPCLNRPEKYERKEVCDLCGAKANKGKEWERRLSEKSGEVVMENPAPAAGGRGNEGKGTGKEVDWHGGHAGKS